MTRTLRLALAAPALLFAAAACSDKSAPADAALQKDIALASQVSPYQPQQYVSGAELGYGQAPYGQPMPYGAYPQPYPPQYYPQPYAYPQQAPVYQPVRTTSSSSSARRSSSASSGARRSSGSGTVVAREPQIVKRNTKRDAAIGAAAGAVLGAATSRDKVKGAIIGAVGGGVLGGIIGHTIDVKRQ